MENLENIGSRIRQFRKSLDKTQAEFAKLTGISTQTQILYEKGTREPKASYLLKLNKEGGDINYILLGKYVPKSSHNRKNDLELIDQVLEIIDLAVNDISDPSNVPSKKIISRISSFSYQFIKDCMDGELKVTTFKELLRFCKIEI